tara:strand:+ start:873 stop:1064 length:192 start_codon:yes stop_codon:yes gene_type:complete
MNDLVFRTVESIPSIDKALQTSLEILIEKKLDDIFESERFIQLVYKAVEDTIDLYNEEAEEVQ